MIINFAIKYFLIKLIAGTYQVEWNAGDYPSGVYFYRIETENYTETKSMILIK